MLTLIRLTLRRATTLLSALLLVLISFQVAIVAIATSLSDHGGFEKIAGLVPAALLHEFGPALTSFGGMSTLGFFEPLIVMLLVQFAIFLATEPAGDVEAGLVDLVLARPIRRHWLMTRSLLVMTGVALALPFTMAVAMWVSLWMFAPMDAHWPDTHVVVLLVFHLAAVSWCFGAAGLAAAALSRRRGSAQAFVGIAAVAFYLMEVIGEAWPRALWVARLSPFHHFHGSGILLGHTHPVSDLAILLSIGLTGVALAYWQFQRRDV